MREIFELTCNVGFLPKMVKIALNDLLVKQPINHGKPKSGAFSKRVWRAHCFLLSRDAGSFVHPTPAAVSATGFPHMIYEKAAAGAGHRRLSNFVQRVKGKL